MSGHSKWAGIKHKKAIIDAKRGKVFTRIGRELTIAAKQGGNPESNARLRKAIEDAKAANMPTDNIKKAIQRGTGELPGVTYEEFIYEGYGPCGVAVMIEITTDNKNRTHSEIRKTFSSHGGNLGDTGCVGWMFQPKGYMVVEKSKVKEDELMNVAIDSGADDVKSDDESVYEIFTAAADFEKVKKALLDKKIPIETAENTMVPSTYIKLEGNDARKMIELADELEENDDVKNVYSNFEILNAEQTQN
ncbi:MAG: YebC/PmpR family DNA-binding transcriptional regulator [Elusimicrobiota bacterium]|nr:YebC/PmpR family DNA-binding transcriptional regulator [Elusimicrobiota bacterium]